MTSIHHLSSVVFMSELTLMFHSARNAGEVTVTLKRYDGRTKPYPKPRKVNKGKKVIVPEPLPEPEEYMCLIRAKHKNKKIATVVKQAEAVKFQMQFMQFLRSSTDALKKERKPRKKAKKATQ
ncbi:UNVERIFIED_CONTAM: hypothetical protein RMT77_006132 [Armadillidium vulgare]|uniref:Signal recognition particle 14 kDa protein n=1 Tax=Armadillidium nasatum TaxID=96803 RepID=A0A5N5SQS5_9CRUS|nr:Signal recognition particle protein [Armadillidium nasatum]RXG60186.1 Signal recognition particle 14 kDa protein [Armadillidium vulgare]